jgi:uncharacterized protein DUF1707/uncharacterized protein DUF4190
MVTQGYATSGGDRGMTRAADTDRDRVVEILNKAYGEGRLTKDEYDGRVETALGARTYADLDGVTADLPVARPPVMAPVTSVGRTNGFAIASLACGIAQFMFGPLPTIPAIVFGHMARGQIRRTGEQGAGLALAGLVLGWGAVVLGLLVVLGLALILVPMGHR